MFYLPIELQAKKENNHAKGPDFNKAKTKRIDIGGNKISMCLPPNRVYWRRHSPELWEPQSYYVLPDSPDYNKANADNRLRLLSNSDDSDDWCSKTIMAREWDFYGAWFTGVLADLRLTLTITQADKPGEASYFHPRVLETSIMDRMAMVHDSSGIGAQIWQVPLRWRQVDNFPCPAVTFMAEPDNDFRAGNDNEYYLVFPIHDNYLIQFRLGVSRTPVRRNGVRLDIEKWTPIAPMEAFAQQIINSVEVELSPQAKAQMKKAHEGLQDASLIKHFAPINVEEYKKNKRAMKRGEVVSNKTSSHKHLSS